MGRGEKYVGWDLGASGGRTMRGRLAEGGAGNRVIFVRNSIGLWPVQGCRREWVQEGHEWSYTELSEMAAMACAGRR